MEQLQELQTQLGLMTWPLIICSALTVMIITERLFHVLISLASGNEPFAKNSLGDPTNGNDLETLAEELSHKRPLLYRGVAMLLAHHSFSKSLREDAAGIWLQEKRHQLHSGLRLLTLIGVISLLVCLVRYLALRCSKASLSQRGISPPPNDLADGLGLAMRTTAAGLIIALPAISGAQIIGLWADRVIAKLEHTLNYVNLWLEGISLQHVSPENSTLAVRSSAKVEAEAQ
ncbi:LOW QUALITY PROTEIN: ferric siderophore transport system, biopolymer transport protein ExbB [Vibrio sp. JCM 18905]|nr:LOW QUALITY PROTEIN: ferric siderophore transport system, biopolymer transport protein ExbB [Vibrio sp. JCM 18905]